VIGINTNFASISAQRNLSATQTGLQTSIERLSSGLRVNSAKDDAAGLAIAERMTAQIRGAEVASRNANDGISLLQIADGAMSSLTNNLQRMRELAVQAKNGTLGTSDRTNLNTEFSELASEVGRVATGSQFNGLDLFAAANKTFSIQVGTGNAAGDTLSVNLTSDGSSSGDDLQTSLGGTTAADIKTELGDVSTVADATTAITTIDQKLDEITTLRSVAGAGLSRLEQTISNLQNSGANISMARGRILDADFAKETAALTRAQILQQAGSAMLVQANQLPNSVLTLLKG
jgi:flagellin